MSQVIVAFESQTSREKLRQIIEGSGGYSCLLCRSGAQVKRAVGKSQHCVIVCGFKLADESCEELYYDLSSRCGMLMVAPQVQLELCEAEGIVKLPTPVRRSELMESLQMLLQLTQRQARPPAQRTAEERELIDQAKAVLMDRHGMTEDQAHRFLQKQSMDAGVKLHQMAGLIIDAW